MSNSAEMITGCSFVEPGPGANAQFTTFTTHMHYILLEVFCDQMWSNLGQNKVKRGSKLGQIWASTGYYRLLLITFSYFTLLRVTTGYYRLLQVTAGYYT